MEHTSQGCVYQMCVTHVFYNIKTRIIHSNQDNSQQLHEIKREIACIIQAHRDAELRHRRDKDNIARNWTRRAVRTGRHGGRAAGQCARSLETQTASDARQRPDAWTDTRERTYSTRMHMTGQHATWMPTRGRPAGAGAARRRASVVEGRAVDSAVRVGERLRREQVESLGLGRVERACWP